MDCDQGSTLPPSFAPDAESLAMKKAMLHMISICFAAISHP